MGRVLQSFRIPRFRAAAFGYFGHMWELYAFYALAPLLAAQWLGNSGGHTVYLAAAGVFAAGGIGCIAGGMISHRWGSARVAIVALAGSAACCLVYPLVPGLPGRCCWRCCGSGPVRGQRLAAILGARRRRLPAGTGGSALALMNSVGFAITIVAIELATGQWETLHDHVAWLLLPGPVLGLIAMKPLWRRGVRTS